MLLELLAKGYINREVLLLKNYKKIGLNENQVTILLLIMRLDSKTITPKEISNYTNLDVKEVQKQLDSLLKAKLIKVSSKTIDLRPLWIKLVQVLEESLELTENDLIKSLNTIFNTKLSLDDVNYLKEKALKKFSTQEIIVLAAQSTAKTFEAFKKELDSEKPEKVKPITKINWL